MTERVVEMDQPVIEDEAANAVRQATERAERAEAELARLKQQPDRVPAGDAALKQPPTPSTREAGDDVAADTPAERGSVDVGGVDELRKDSMMAHLLDSLEAGKDIGHYGRLIFAMVARHFLPHAEVMAWLTRDRDFSDEQAELMLRQVEGRDYNPPRRNRILEWQREQEFPILDVNDPDSGNLYRNLKFPDEVYQHIGHYQEAKAAE